MDLPGEAKPNDKEGLSVLVAPVLATKEADYPSFEFRPVSATRMRIEIEILNSPENPEEKRGCLGVLILDRKPEGETFQN